MPNKIRKRRQPASRVSISPRRTRSHARKTQLDNKQPPPPSRPTTINKQSQRRQLPATVNKASTKKTNKPPNNDVPRLQLSDILSIPRHPCKCRVEERDASRAMRNRLGPACAATHHHCRLVDDHGEEMAPCHVGPNDKAQRLLMITADIYTLKILDEAMRSATLQRRKTITADDVENATQRNGIDITPFLLPSVVKKISDSDRDQSIWRGISHHCAVVDESKSAHADSEFRRFKLRTKAIGEVVRKYVVRYMEPIVQNASERATRRYETEKNHSKHATHREKIEVVRKYGKFTALDVAIAVKGKTVSKLDGFPPQRLERL